MFERLKLAYRALTSTLSQPRRWLVDMWGSTESKSGAEVNQVTAVQVTAVFACVRLLAQTLASLPLNTYKRIEGGKEKATEHNLYNILHNLANPECTSYQLRVVMMVNLLLTGHAFAEIVRNRAGQVIELWPIPTNKVYIKRNKNTGELFYEVQLDLGGVKLLYPETMLHIPWVGMECVTSYNPVLLAREAIGLSIAAEEFGARFFENGANASGIAEYPGKMSDEAYDRFKSSFNDKYTGLDKSQRVMFLEQGLKFTKLTVNPNEAQAVETRKFQVIEIARFYNVPPHLIMDLERSTFSNIEHQDIGFVKYSLRPYLISWEQEMLKSLFLPAERNQYFAEFNVDGLLRGDAKSRAEALDIMMRNGVINADEWRSLENMNPQPDELGQIYYVPLNWVPKDQQQMMIEEQQQDPEPDVERQQPELEKRALQRRNASQRLQTAQNFQRLFADAAARIVRREKKQVLDKAKKTLNERSQQEFDTWLEQYYRDAPEWMKKAMMPVLMSLTEAIQRLAANEVNAATGLTAELQQWMSGYADNWTRDYTASSLGQLRALIRKANSEGLDALEEIETRLNEWEQKRPDKVASAETIQATGVVSKFVYSGAGVRTLVWINAGDSTCEFCTELDGKVVGIDQPFLGRNDSLAAEDRENPMRVYKPTFTPQLHQKCQCMIAAN